MEPLNLPRGSVRAAITLTLVLGLVPVAIWAPEAGLTAYAALAGVAIRDYFATRQTQNEQNSPSVPQSAARGGG
jgi:hypothetical protein